MSDLTQQQLEEIVEGKPQQPRIVFYDKARMNVEKSKIAGHRVYDTITYLKETQAGVTDWTPQKARADHIKKYPEEYQNYLNARQGEKSLSIEIIPNITPAETQELIDYGLGTIRNLAEAKQVPPHLSLIHQNAKVLHAVFMEQHHGEEESSIPQVEEVTEAGLLSEANRQHNTPDVGRPPVPEGTRLPEREVTEGIQAGGRNEHRQTLSSDWSISL